MKEEKEWDAGLFPSGPWRGFHTCFHGKIRLRLDLGFRAGIIVGRGTGREPFAVSGSYDPLTLKCRFRHEYHGACTDVFLGFREGRGIWGTWRCLEKGCTGGFMIWPGYHGDGSGLFEEEEAHPRDAELDPCPASSGIRHVKLISQG